MAQEYGIETARRQLGNLADAAYHHGVTTYLTRHGRRIAAITPLGRAVAGIGDRVVVDDEQVPEEWAKAGEIIEMDTQSYTVRLDDGHLSEVLYDQVTIED